MSTVLQFVLEASLRGHTALVIDGEFMAWNGPLPTDLQQELTDIDYLVLDFLKANPGYQTCTQR